MSTAPYRDKSELRTRSRGKGKGKKKKTSKGSSFSMRSTYSNIGYSDSSTRIHDFYPLGQSSYFQTPRGYHPPFPNYNHINQVKIALKVKVEVKDLIFIVIPLIDETTSITPFLKLKREILTVKIVKHPNIIRLDEVLYGFTNIYIILEFVYG
ncbi:hypothetical protein GQ457_18G006280 [Hibiscus cannabinus]